MLFTQSAEQRAYERMMTAIPNFSPRGHGVYYFRARPTWEDYSVMSVFINPGKMPARFLLLHD